MSQVKVDYIIFAPTKDEESAMLKAPLEDGDREYFVKGLLPTLRPLSDKDYMQGPAVILHTMAKYSYILYQTDVYWCAEWEPGLVVVRFSPDGTLAWSALRSPIPDFGGRAPKAKDLLNFDEDAENHQYNLVFNAWDAQFDEDWRKWRSFKPASAKTVRVYEAALAHIQTLGAQMEARYSSEDKFYRWVERCKRNLEKWAGEGVRVALSAGTES